MEKEIAALKPARGKRDPNGVECKLARSGDRDETAVDLISRLPDDILGTVISLLSTREGGRTQALSRRWRHLWLSAPLNLEVSVYAPVYDRAAVHPYAVSTIISEHPGPARRFYFLGLPSSSTNDLYSAMESWFHSRAFAALQELHISLPRGSSNRLLLSALRSASTLLVAKIRDCDFPYKIEQPMNFPLLKQLSLISVSIPADVLHGLLSGCHALESLFISRVRFTGCLRVSSPTLRSIGFLQKLFEIGHLIIENAPCLERILLPEDCVALRVIRAPKLKILGPCSPIWFLQGTRPVSSANSMRTLKILALGCTDRELHTVLDVLRVFPCLERLYVTFHSDYKDWKNEPPYDPQHPVECLQTHLKKVVFNLKSYIDYDHQADFVRFFVLNAKVLNKIEFKGICDYNSESVAYLSTRLQLENRASRDAKFEFRSQHWHAIVDKHIHDLSVPDPFSQL